MKPYSWSIKKSKSICCENSVKMHQYSFLFFLKFFLGEVKIKDAISMDYKQLTMLDNDLWP